MHTLRIIIKLQIITGLLVIFSACNSGDRQPPIKGPTYERKTNQFFLMGSEAISKQTISEIVEQSGIKLGGYVVIIQSHDQHESSVAKLLKSEFNSQQVMAVHILEFSADSTVKNTDVLAIENANIICLLSNSPDEFMKLANNTRLRTSILKAGKNGTLISGIGKGSSLLGEYYYDQKVDTGSNEMTVTLKHGLGLLKSTVIDNSNFLSNYRNNIQAGSSKNNYVFIGIEDNSCVWINNSEALVLNKTKVELISPDGVQKQFKEDNEFSLLLQ